MTGSEMGWSEIGKFGSRTVNLGVENGYTPNLHTCEISVFNDDKVEFVIFRNLQNLQNNFVIDKSYVKNSSKFRQKEDNFTSKTIILPS